jgi:hypothetical protein
VSGLKYVVAALVAATSAAVLSAPAEATWWRRGGPCVFDPFGYRPPTYRDCYRVSWGFYPAYGFYPAGSYYATPRYPVQAVPAPAFPGYPATYCYFDNGFDMRPRRICVPSGW